ncbi:clavesin-1-like [Pararge aegeria]|uniref:clavesin-1-like n=1 Tax=Pararge aegeria TaxID=116150 RepID=UPI0019CFD1F1|nr:clavesin-1-like [Pararge aegeria]
MISMEEECKKTGVTPSDIAALRGWLKTQPHLPEKYITDFDLLLAYYCCFKSSAVAKKVLDINFTLRTLFTNLFQNRVVDKSIIKTLDVVCALPLKASSIDKHYRVIYHSLIDHDAKNFIFTDVIRTVLMLVDVTQYRDGTAPGYLILIDLNGVSLSHITKLDLQTVQQILYFLQEAILIRLRGVHFLNAPSYIDRLMMILRPFIKKELMNMVCIHSAGSNSIEKLIPVEALPIEAGGKFKSYAEAKSEATELLLSNKEFFINENKKRVVESLRPGKPKTITDIFGGIEGSFKKLDID